jgi:hypothetical protein
MVVCRAGSRGLTLSCWQGPIGVHHHTPGSFTDSSVAVPLDVLADLDVGGRELTLQQLTANTGRATWTSQGEPLVIDFDTSNPDSLPASPGPVPNAARVGPGFLRALRDSSDTVGQDGGLLDQDRILLRRRDGAVIATDGRQLLVQTGFAFPWQQDWLIPALPVWGSRELAGNEPVKLLLEGEHITLQTGPWLFHLKCEQADRYPDIDQVVPSGAVSCLQIDAEDSSRCLRALPRLSGCSPPRSVTLDLGSPVAIRAEDAQGRIEEVTLARSKVSGPALLVVTDRRYLIRALRLGFLEILVAQPDRPLLCRDATRCYAWAPLVARAVVRKAT